MTIKDKERYNRLQDSGRFYDWGQMKLDWEPQHGECGMFPLNRPEHYYNAVEFCPQRFRDELDLWEHLKTLRRYSSSYAMPKSARGFEGLSHVKKKTDRRLREIQDLIRFFDPEVRNLAMHIYNGLEVTEVPITAEMAYSMLPPDNLDTDFIVWVEKRQGKFVTRGIFDTRELNTRRIEALERLKEPGGLQDSGGLQELPDGCGAEISGDSVDLVGVMNKSC